MSALQGSGGRQGCYYKYISWPPARPLAITSMPPFAACCPQTPASQDTRYDTATRRHDLHIDHLLLCQTEGGFPGYRLSSCPRFGRSGGQAEVARSVRRALP